MVDFWRKNLKKFVEISLKIAAYKEITSIIDDLVELKLVEVIAVFRPLITYKV
jgi:RNA-splicing ligase RtcB